PRPGNEPGRKGTLAGAVGSRTRSRPRRAGRRGGEKESVYLAVSQPAFALFGAGVQIGEAPADDERPDVVLILGQLEVEGGWIADLLAGDQLRAADVPRFEGAVDRLCPLV